MRVELLGGIPAKKITKYPPHNFTVDRLSVRLNVLAFPDYLVREVKSVQLRKDWRPEPDVVVVPGPDDRYRKADPTAAEIALIAEVAESTYPTDRGVKWQGYAAAGIRVYWIVNREQRSVEVYTNSAGRGKQAKYDERITLGTNESIPLNLDGREIGRIAVNEILP